MALPPYQVKRRDAIPSTKVLISIDDDWRMKRIEITRVKNLSRRMSHWIESKREPGKLLDPVSLMKGVRNKIVEKLAFIGLGDQKMIMNPQRC